MAESKEDLERTIKDTNIHPELREQARQRLIQQNAPRQNAPRPAEDDHNFQGASEGFRR